MKRHELACPRCGEQQHAIEITRFGDAEREYMPQPCECPQARCCFCMVPIDERGRCTNIDCFMLNIVVPLPVIA